MPTTAIKQPQIQNTVFDLDTMSEVLLVKSVPDFMPAENTSEVLERIGNDPVKMLELMNNALRIAERKAVADNSEPWHTFELDESGDETDKVNGPFTGTIADIKAVNALRLTLSKTVFNYSKSMTPDEKKAAKAAAMDMIKNTEAIKNGLKRSAAIHAPVPVADEATS